jgi:hypothetical protein
MPNQDTVRIPLRAKDGSVRAYALIDAADVEWVNRWRWYLTTGYAARSEVTKRQKRTIFLHRMLLGLRPGDGFEGDHINRDTLDDRRSNLRRVRRAQGHQNLPSQKRGTSSKRGVGWIARLGKWRARLMLDGKEHHLGLFETEQEAAEAARAGRARLMPFSVD